MAFPQGSNHGMVAPQLPQAPVKINCVLDTIARNQRKSTAAAKAYHPLMKVPNEITDQQFIAAPGQAIFTRRAFNKAAGRNTPGSRQQSQYGNTGGGMNENGLVPVETTLNGIAASTNEELEDEAVFLGVVENPGNRDNNQVTLNGITGGSVPRPNDDKEAHAAGDYNIWCAPTNGNSDDMHSRRNVPSNARIANQVGGPHGSYGESDDVVGPVTFVQRLFRPEMVNFQSPDTMRSVFAKHHNDAAEVNKSEDIHAGFLQSYVDLLASAVYVAGKLKIKGLDPATDLKYGSASHKRKRGDNLAALQEALGDGTLNDALADAANSFMMHQWAKQRLRVHRRVQWKQLVGAGKGDDGVIQSIHYML